MQMAQLNVDPEDVAFAMAAFIGNSVVVGIATFNLFNFSFGDTLFTLSGTNISYAFAMAAAAFAATVLTNDGLKPTELHGRAAKLRSSKSVEYGDLYYGAVLACIVLPVAWVFIPDVSSFFSGSDLAGLGYVAVFQLGQVVVGYVL